MVRQKRRPEAKRFDSRLKALFGKEVEQIIPLLFPGARVISECNVELNRSTLAADLVYNIFYEGEEQLLNSEGDFRAHLERFRLMLERSTTMSKHAKKEFKEVLEVQYGYNWIIDENPEVIEKVALAEERGEERGKEEGKEEGIIEGMQRLVINGIKLRFPAMEVMAQAQIQQVKEAGVLEQLHYDLLTVSDETAMLHLLYALSQKQRNNTFHDQVSEC